MNPRRFPKSAKAVLALGISTLVITGCGGPIPETEAAPARATFTDDGANTELATGNGTGLISTPVPQGMARLVIYRAQGFGILPSAIQPQVKVNKQAVGNCERKSVIMQDVAPGVYSVSIQTDIVARKSVTVSAGQVVYLACGILPFGILVPAPTMKVVAVSDIPERVHSLPRQ